MTADEMFEKLGYETIWDIDECDEYISYQGNQKLFVFYLDKKEVEITNYSSCESSNINEVTLNMEELQAINQQIKELGWYEE